MKIPWQTLFTHRINVTRKALIVYTHKEDSKHFSKPIEIQEAIMSTSNTPNNPWAPLTAMNPWFDASQPLLNWWAEQGTQAIQPFAKVQQAWMESMSQAMQAEMQFFQAITESHEKMAKCMMNASGSPESNRDMADCYQEVVQTLADAQMTRLHKASELSHEFRRSLWEEL